MTLRAVSAEYFSVHLRALLAEGKIAPLGEPVDACVLDQNDGTLLAIVSANAGLRSLPLKNNDRVVSFQQRGSPTARVGALGMKV